MKHSDVAESGISIDDILAELRADEWKGDDGETVSDIMARIGTANPNPIRRRLRQAIDAGAVVVGRQWRLAIDGTQRHVPVYRVVRAAKLRKAKR